MISINELVQSIGYENFYKKSTNNNELKKSTKIILRKKNKNNVVFNLNKRFYDHFESDDLKKVA